MKKSVKISLWLIGTFIALLIAAFLCADIIASRIVKREVAKTFANMPDADAALGGIYLNLISGSAIVKDITFSTNSLTVEDQQTGRRAPGLAIHVPTISVLNIHYWELFKEHRLVMHSIAVDGAQLIVYIDEEHPETLLPAFPKDTTLAKANEWLKSIEVYSFSLGDFSARLHSTRSPLVLAADTLSFETKDLAYNFVDSTFAYNDSVYSLKLRSLHLETPDGFFALNAHDFKTKNQGPVELGYTRLFNVIEAKKMADLMREPVSWIDLELNSFSTSPFNPIRKALAEDYNLDLIKADVKQMHVIRDARYQPKTPFSTPQDFLKKLPVRFCVKKVEANVHQIDIDMQTTDINCGKMQAKDIYASMTNVTNKPGAVWTNHAKAPFGKQGKVDAAYVIRMDKNASFDIKLDATDVETEDLNSFIRPLIGITSTCHIDHLDAAYSGDREMAKGEFCMAYHGLDVKVHKEDNIPYEIVSKHADMFTNLANSLVPKSNPTSVDPAPRRYMVEWKRDEWKPYPLFLFGPCIDGVKLTMLPGLYVHKQVGKKKH